MSASLGLCTTCHAAHHRPHGSGPRFASDGSAVPNIDAWHTGVHLQGVRGVLRDRGWPRPIDVEWTAMDARSGHGNGCVLTESARHTRNKRAKRHNRRETPVCRRPAFVSKLTWQHAVARLVGAVKERWEQLEGPIRANFQENAAQQALEDSTFKAKPECGIYHDSSASTREQILELIDVKWPATQDVSRVGDMVHQASVVLERSLTCSTEPQHKKAHTRYARTEVESRNQHAAADDLDLSNLTTSYRRSPRRRDDRKNGARKTLQGGSGRLPRSRLRPPTWAKGWHRELGRTSGYQGEGLNNAPKDGVTVLRQRMPHACAARRHSEGPRKTCATLTEPQTPIPHPSTGF